MRTLELSKALRSLTRAPAFAAGVVLTLGLGIGVTASAFSVVRGVLLKPLPHEAGDRLMYLRQTAAGAGIENALFSVPEIDEYRLAVSSFDGVAEFSSMRFSALGLDRPRQVQVGIVTGNFFQVMGLGATLGRPLSTDDDPEGSDAVAVLTTPMWQTVFGGDPDVVGTTFQMNGRSVTVVGVAEPHPPYPERTDMYVNMVTSPHHLSASMNHDRKHRMTEVFARLTPAASVERARAEARAVAERGRTENAEAYDASYGYSVELTTLKDQLSRRARTILFVLVVAAGLVLLVALANVANLVLTRAARLSDELSIRASLGATSRDLRARLLSENAVLGLAGAFLGTMMALSGIPVLSTYLSRFSVRAADIRVDLAVLAGTLLLAIASSIVLSYLPRLPADRRLEGLARSGRSGTSRRFRRTQSAMVGAQVAVSLVLVFGAGLLAQTLLNLQSIDTGIELDQVLALDVPAVANGRSRMEVQDDYLAMVSSIEALPGVRRAALTNTVPMRTEGFLVSWISDFALEGREQAPGGPPFRSDFRIVSGGYFDALDMDLLSGRTLGASDDPGAPLVAVVNQAWVQRFFDGRDPVGQRFMWTSDFTRFMGLSEQLYTIVGVVSDIREHSVERAPSPAAFLSYRQAPFAESLLVRADENVSGLSALVSAAVRGVEPDQPVENVATLAAIGEERLGETRLNARLVGMLAGLSLLIAAVGIFAALAFSVSQRTREMGLRMALGADQARVVRKVMREGMGMVGVGILVGIAGSYASSSFLSGMVYGVPATDPWTLVAGSITLLLVAAVATALPALRAARVHPARVLSGE